MEREGKKTKKGKRDRQKSHKGESEKRIMGKA